jgi:chromosome segregation ATPase
MQAIQTTFDQRDKDQLRKLATDLELAKQEVTTLREKIEQERTLAKEATIQLELRTTDHQEKLAEKEREIAKYKEESIKEKSKAESFERENRNLVSRVSILERQTETRLNVGSTMQIDGDVGSIETETLRRDLQITQEALQTKRDIENDLISKLRSSEESRIEIISEYEKYREQIERERRESVTRIEQLQNALDVQASQVEEANQQRKQLERDLQQAHLENERQIGQLQALRNEVESTKDQFNNDNSGASELRRQYEEQKQIYEDIVVKSGKYLEEIAHNKEQIAELRRQLQDSQLRVSSLTNELGTIQNSYDQRESILRAELAQTNVRQKDLERARDILMSENETLNIQLKKILPTEKEGSTDEREEVDSLRELLRLIRREKEMVSSKLTVTEHESLRNKQMYEQAQRDIEHLRAEIEQLHSAQVSKFSKIVTF